MGDTEEYFPRGGKKPSVTYFKQSSNFLGAAEKGERKKQKPKKKTEDDDGYLSDEVLVDDDQSFKNCAISLNYKIVKEGQLILGRVRQILETKIHISLPCRLLGTVMACHISEPYNKMLEAYVNDQIDKVRELQQMFRVGQYVAVKVLEVNTNNLMLSMMPQHINSGRSHSDLHRGALLQAAVSSVEDHGYVMDIGISNTRAFLPKTAANPEMELEKGTLSWCCVKTITAESDSSVVTLSSELVALQHAVQRRATDSLMPATALDFTVDKSLDNGIEGHVFEFENTTAYVQRQQVDKVKGKKPNLGQRIRARVLYVIPTRNTPFLTMKDIFATTYPDLATEQRFKEGDIEEAQVIKILGRSIIFKLGRGSTGTLSLRRIQVDEDLTDEDVVAKSYPIGSTHRVRVLCYNLSDYTYSLSDEPAILSEKYFTIADLAVGDIVPATVKVVAEDRLHLTVGRLTGFVPQTHLSDSGVYKDPKKATTSQLTKKKFKVGQEVKARVLTLDPSKPSLILTLKPSLLVPELEVLKSYEQAEVGKAYTGVILHIRDYLLVSFFNGLVAHVPGKFVANPPPPTLNSVFHLGQIVNCTILKVDAKNKRMSGSLTTAPFEPSLQKKEKTTSKRRQEPELPVPKKKQKGVTSEAEVGEETEGDLTKKERKKKKDKRKLEEETQEVEMVYVNDKNASDEKEHCDRGNYDSEETKKSKKKKDKTKSINVTEKSDEEYELFKPDEETELFKPDEETVDKVLPLQSSTKDIKIRKRQISEPTVEESDAGNEPTAKPDIKSKIKRDDDIDTNTDTSKVKRKEKKKKKEAVEILEKETKVNEESDAIETDIYEDSDQVLTPQDLGLIDMSDCSTAKSYKKRIKSLLKGIKARMLRIKKIDNKITAIESKGLNANNKKFHTAMHMEKLVIQQRIQKLMEALQIAQDRLKDFDLDEVKDYKKKKLKKTEDEQVEKTNVQKTESEKEKTDVQKTESEKERAKVTEKNKKSKIESLESVISIPSVKEFWSAPVESQPNAPEQDSSSSDDEEREKPKKKRKKLTAAEKVAKAREEEERVRQLESFAVESDLAPRSAEQFERALLARPDASQLWIAYMAFHLQATEIEKARAVGRKALKTISFREEQEKLNVWLAMLNFEHRFGTKESQQKTLEEALQMNDKYQIHSKLLDIYVETGKPQELVALVELMLRKYRRELRSYIACGAACYRLALLDKARHVMQKGISLLEKKEHVGLLVQFAQLERAHGSGERAEALFEQLLAVYPQRVDVCAVYIDILVKSGDVEKVRQVMDRMTSQKLPARKMKVLYKKWIEVEEKMGDQEHVDNIRKRAMEYIDKAKF